MFLESTYHFEGEPVLFVAGFQMDESDNTTLFCDAVFVHPHLTDDVYTLVGDSRKHKVRLREEMLLLSKPKVFHMTMLKREVVETI